MGCSGPWTRQEAWSRQGWERDSPRSVPYPAARAWSAVQAVGRAVSAKPPQAREPALWENPTKVAVGYTTVAAPVLAPPEAYGRSGARLRFRLSSVDLPRGDEDLINRWHHTFNQLD